NSDIPDARVQALRAAAYVSAQHVDKAIAASIDDEHASVRLAAVESGLSRGLPRAREMAVAYANRLDDSAAPYLKLIAMFGTANDHEIVFEALRVPALQKPAIWALGQIGTARAVDVCVAGMQHEKLARASGEAYCWITGVELSRDGLTKQEVVADAPA